MSIFLIEIDKACSTMSIFLIEIEIEIEIEIDKGTSTAISMASVPLCMKSWLKSRLILKSCNGTNTARSVARNPDWFLRARNRDWNRQRNEHGHSYGPCSTVHEILIEIDIDRCCARAWLMNIHIYVWRLSRRDVTARQLVDFNQDFMHSGTTFVDFNLDNRQLKSW